MSFLTKNIVSSGLYQFDKVLFAREISSPIVAPAHLRMTQTSGAISGNTSPLTGATGLLTTTGDACVEGYFQTPVVVHGNNILMCYLPGWSNLVAYLNSTGRMGFMHSGNGSFVVFTSGAASINTLYHWAIFRISNVLYLAVQGVIIGSVALSGTLSDGPVHIGYSPYAQGAAGQLYAGIRITTGNSRYTNANFTPPSSFPTSIAGDSLFDNVRFLTDMSDPQEVVYDVVEDPVKSAVLSLGYTGIDSGLTLRSKTPSSRVGGVSPEYSGQYKIVGFVKIDDEPDAPVARRVRLYDQSHGRFVMETWSAEGTGAYLFDFIRGDRKYFVVAEDYNHLFNAVIADNILPELR